MKFKYNGDLPAVLYRGVAFTKGEYVTVSEEMAARLEALADFSRKPGPKKAKSDDA